MSWYHIPGNQQDVAVSTRVRLARNLAGYSFPARLIKASLGVVTTSASGVLNIGLSGTMIIVFPIGNILMYNIISTGRLLVNLYTFKKQPMRNKSPSVFVYLCFCIFKIFGSVLDKIFIKYHKKRWKHEKYKQDCAECTDAECLQDTCYCTRHKFAAYKRY